MRRLPSALLITCLALAPGAVLAQEPGEASEEMTRKERRQAAKKRRQDAYLQRVDDRKSRKAARQAEKADGQPTDVDAVEQPVDADELAAAAERARLRKKLPRRLAMAQEAVESSYLGETEAIRDYISLIDLQAASPQQLAAFGNHVAEAGMLEVAAEYYDVAVGIDRKDPLLWLNLGTLQRKLGDVNKAASSFARALSLDATNANAHYNLAAVLDEMGKYDEAVEEYRLALTLDPSLGDPKVNPSAANNERLTAVKLLLFADQGGSLMLPLSEVPEGTIRDDGASTERRR